MDVIILFAACTANYRDIPVLTSRVTCGEVDEQFQRYTASQIVGPGDFTGLIALGGAEEKHACCDVTHKYV
jgi:hypothetical protein